LKPRLLILDDDHNILALLRAYFGGLGWHVESCADAPTGLELADSDAPFEAVICDLHFTGDHLGEGYEILSRARQRRPDSAVVLFTGAVGEGIREEALRRGADDVVPKPAPLARLREATLRAMKKA
jgi:two-component system, response regulator RegA